ncbi:hypothetical protein ACOMHN_058427 [Nucella lapillus]
MPPFETQNSLSKGQAIDHLAIAVPPELKQKIIGGKFIDLSLLLKKSFSDSIQDRELTFEIDGEGCLMATKGKKPKTCLTIEQWTNAFHVLMSVYLQVQAQDVQGMLAYIALIREAADVNPGNGWSLYDQQFRSRKETEPSRPWGMIDNQLWLQIFCRPPQGSYQLTPTGTHTQKGNEQKLAQNTKPTCIYFKKQKGCFRQTCSYLHKCSRCDSTGHALTACPGQKPAQTGRTEPKTRDLPTNQQSFHFGTKNTR